MDEETKKLIENHEERIKTLEELLSSKTRIKGNRATEHERGQIREARADSKLWYKPDSTVAKLIGLVSDGFFDEPKTLSEVTVQFAAKDYHYKLSDLTLPVRQLVRRGVLRREQRKGKWAYGKI
jgi:hypothetical protein